MFRDPITYTAADARRDALIDDAAARLDRIKAARAEALAKIRDALTDYAAACDAQALSRGADWDGINSSVERAGDDLDEIDCRVVHELEDVARYGEVE